MRTGAFLFVGVFCALTGAAQAQDKGKIAEEVNVEETFSSVVRVRTRILPNARSAATLGPQREGSGVLVRDGFVATIGYLVIESESIEVTGADGKSVPASLAAYDHASGFGLLKLLAPLAGKPLPIGKSNAAAEREPALVAGYGADGVNLVHVVSRRPFSGSWEYMLDTAIFTYPAVMNWSGASLISAKGELLGLGSLIVTDASGSGVQSPGNMFVPAELLQSILEDLIARGKAPGPVRPWMGVNAEEMRGRLFVTRVSPEGPADKAGLKGGDILIGVGSDEVSSLAEFYRKVWALGAAGVDVPLRVLQGVQVKEVTLRSIDRMDYFRARPSY
ncbi:MAG: serine protease [Betaproteobacteria bacterium]|nr:serine protease [Betaproteobacteria bacterium]